MGGFSIMRPVEGRHGAFAQRLSVPTEAENGDEYLTEFQIAVDRDALQLLYPQMHNAGSGEGFLVGPDRGPWDQDRRCWLIRGLAGATYEVTLDTKAGDRRKMVSWRLA